jgi:hypothetical protein
VTALYPAGIVTHRGQLTADTMTFDLTRGTAGLPDGHYVYARAP